MPKLAEKQRPQRIFLEKIGVVIFLTLYLMSGVVLAAFYSLSRVYAERIYPGVTVAGVDFSGQTWDEAEREIGTLIQTLGETSIPIEVEGGESSQPTLSELGVNFDKDAILSSLFAIGHASNLWDGVVVTIRSLAGGRQVPISASFDQKLLESYVEEITAALAKKSQNATLKVTSGVVEIVPGEIGEEADPDYLAAEITRRLRTLQVQRGQLALTPIHLEIARSRPDIMEQDLGEVLAAAQVMIGEAITTEFEGKTYTFTPSDIGSWLIFPEVDEQGRKTYQTQFDDKKINSSIAAKVAKPIDIKMVPKKILITTGQVIEEGKDGRSLDRNKLLSEIKQLLVRRTRTTLVLGVSTVPKTEQQVYPDFTLGLYEGRYIEINLTSQTLYAIEGNILVGSYPVSTGKPSTPTPSNTYYIATKHLNPRTDQYLIREGYRLWMPYWNGLSTTTDLSGYDGYGIHELPCFNSACTRREGLAHLGRPVSHGCIRLGIGPAAFVYDWAPLGTPVYIHK